MKISRPRLAAAFAPAALGIAAAITIGSMTGGARSADTQVRLDAAVQQATVQQAASVPVLVNCRGGHDVRPEHFVLACGDGDTWLGHMSWQRWGTTAAGQGTLAIDDCVPDCAQGTYRHFPVQIALSQPKALPDGSGRRYFSELTETFPGKHCMPGYDGTTYCIPSPNTIQMYPGPGDLS